MRFKIDSIVVGVVLGITLQFLHLRSCPGQSATNPVTAQSIAADLGFKGSPQAYLLALLKKVDARPLYVDEALVAIEYKKNRWKIIHAGRHPNAKTEADRTWTISYITDCSLLGSKDFRHRPTQREVEDFLRNSAWHFQATEPFRTIKSEIFTNEWKAAFGYEPKHGSTDLDGNSHPQK